MFTQIVGGIFVASSLYFLYNYYNANYGDKKTIHTKGIVRYVETIDNELSRLNEKVINIEDTLTCSNVHRALKQHLHLIDPFMKNYINDVYISLYFKDYELGFLKNLSITDGTEIFATVKSNLNSDKTGYLIMEYVTAETNN